MDLIWIFGILLIIVFVLIYIWKHVNPPPAPPVLTLDVTPSVVEQGQNVVISGTLMKGGSPQVGQMVSITVAPPTGDIVPLSDDTDSVGAFLTTWSVPSDGELGVYTVEVAYPGAVSVTKTFTQIIDKRVE